MVATSFIFDILRIEWENSGWNIEELKYLCLAIDASCDELNPNNFIYCQVAFIDEIKIYLNKIIIKKMDEYLLFEDFENGKYINENDLPKVINYICGHLISWSPNRSYFECQYNYATKLKIVCRWRRKRGLGACAKKGETICEEKLGNFFNEKEHKNCACSRV